MLNFDVNVSILLKEYPFLERFDQAARLGFDAVEFWWPTGESLDAVAQRIRDAGLRVALFNFDGGDLPAGDRGLLNDPERQAQFRANVPVALEFAQRIGCSRINALAGHWLPGEDRAAQLERVRDALHWTAEQAQIAGVTIMIEALNTWENGPYLFSNSRHTAQFIDTLDAPNVKFQYDVYHMQRMEGNIVTNVREYLAYIDHIQVADAPHRGVPGTGELNFRYIFQEIEALGYTGSIGLEYLPHGPSEHSFDWLPVEGRRSAPVDGLRL